MSDQPLLKCVRRNLFRNDLAYAKTKRGRLNASMIRAEPSDNGAGANAIYAALEHKPLWQKLWMRGRATLRPRHRAVLDALLVDMRPRIAARLAGVSKNMVYACVKKIFKTHFAQCYQAYRALSSR